MPKNKSAHGNADTSVSDSSKRRDDLKTEENKLKQEIEEIQSIITQTSLSINILKYGNVKTLQQTKTADVTKQTFNTKSIPNVSTKLQNELYRYSGFYCSKFTKAEYVFNFTSNKNPKDNFAVQILNKNNCGSLGKWVLPISIDIDEILSEIPIDNLKNLIPFLKKCRYLIDCYSKRQEEFETFKKSTESIKNFSIDSDMGYIQIIMEFSGMHNKQNEKSINILVYLLYKSRGIRPYKVKIESNEKKKLDNKTLDNLKQLFKCFKILSLEEAFEQIHNNQNDSFMWSLIDEDSPLELNYSSSSEENYLDDIKQKRKKATKRKKQLKNLQQKWKQQKRVLSSRISNQADDSDDENSPLIAKKKAKGNHSPKKKETDHENLLQKRTKNLKNKSYITMTSTSDDTRKLKQTKLKFGAAKNSTEIDKEHAPLMSEIESTPSEKLTHRKKITDVVTSTPLYPTRARHLKIPEVDLEISDIVNTKKKLSESIRDTGNIENRKKVTFETKGKSKTHNKSLHKLRKVIAERKKSLRSASAIDKL